MRFLFEGRIGSIAYVAIPVMPLSLIVVILGSELQKGLETLGWLIGQVFWNGPGVKL